MIYLSGSTFTGKHNQVGLMATPDTGNIMPADTWWAFDNACFAHAGEFDYDRWKRVLGLRMAEAPGRCLFVVAPDIPFDAEGTVRRFAEYRDRLLSLNVPLAFVTQDGMGVEDLPWGDIAAVFVGGSTAWKTGHESQAIVTEAKRRGKWVHMGRVNSLRRWQVAVSMGCDSADGTFLKYAPDINWPRLMEWIDAARLRPVLVLP